MYALKIHDPEAVQIKKINGKYQSLKVRELVNTLRSSDRAWCEAEALSYQEDGMETEIVEEA